MGRSRAAVQTTDEDSSHSRSKRKKNVRNGEDIETIISVPGITDGKKPLYHCNYCNKDISTNTRIKCVICSDFDLCIECFSVGAEVFPHKSNHPYRIMDDLAFPLICADWNADEEILLLEGIEMYGLNNWTEVAEHVGTKSKSQCAEHYSTIYINSPCFPLPDMSRVMGKNRDELVSMAREQTETNKGTISPEYVDASDKIPSEGIMYRVEDERPEDSAEHSSLNIPSGDGHVGGSGNGTVSAGGGKSTSSNMPHNDGLHDKVEDRSIGEKKPRKSGNECISLKELRGYNCKRQEFDVEYDNDAEQLLADMEFKETDTDAERELKLQVLRIYSKRLDERKRRKNFILDRGLLRPDTCEKDLTLEEMELSRRYRVFMRYHSKDKHDELLKTVIEEHRIMKRIKWLQEARAAGCRTSAEAYKYIERKITGTVANSSQEKESTHGDSKDKHLQRINLREGEKDIGLNEGISNSNARDADEDSQSTVPRHSFLDITENWDVTGFIGANLLSEEEKQLCGEIRILPTHYLSMLRTMSVGILNGKLSEKSDAYALFNVDPGKVDKIYDRLVTQGITQVRQDLLPFLESRQESP